MIRRTLWILPVFASFICGCGVLNDVMTAERVHGSGIVVKENREVRGFSKVRLASQGELSIRQGNEESLAIETDDNILPKIKTVVESGRLTIETERGVSVSPTAGIRYTLMVKDLDNLELSGSGKVHAGPLHSGSFVARLPGSGTIRLDALEAGALQAEISGSGNIEIAGMVKRQEAHISGSGKYDAPDLQCKAADVSISGSGHITLWAQESLAAHISGSGSVGYYGNPALTKNISGSGSVRHIGDR
jgi:hypothetical protein